MTSGDVIGWGLAALLWLGIAAGGFAAAFAVLVVGALFVGGFTRPRRELRAAQDDFRVLLAIADGARHHVVDDIQPTSGVRIGRLYPALSRLERSGDVTSGWADGPEPQRRWYQLTPAGLRRATSQVLPE